VKLDGTDAISAAKSKGEECLRRLPNHMKATPTPDIPILKEAKAEYAKLQ
jgi:hypothetical protein